MVVRPSAYEIDPPVGAVMSGVGVKEPVEVRPAPFVAVTVLEPNAVAVSSHV